MASIKYKDNGTYKDIVVKVGDTLPIGTEVDYEGATAPAGWEEITDYDTGWQNLTLLNGVTARSGNQYKPRYRRIGNVVYILGQVTIPAHSSQMIIAILPEGFRPTFETRMLALTTNNWIDPAGNMWVATDTAERTNQPLKTEFLID